MTQSFETLVDLLRWRAQSQPERIAYCFSEDGETIAAALTYQALDLRARVIGQYLRSVAGVGDRVLVLYPPGLEYLAAFFGCLYAGVVAVPAYPPRLNRNALRLQSIAADAGASIALTVAQNQKAVEGLFTATQQWTRWQVIDTTKLPEHFALEWQEPDIAKDQLAFIQYTSGSTGNPQGVMLSHANLLHNSRLLRDAFEYDADSRCVSWLPMYHDMGLIGSILQPLYGGYCCTLMPPATFFQSPIKWLNAISRDRATISGGPNFAYDLCVEKTTPEQRAELDLSSWSVAFNGSEAVRHETMKRFAEAFAPCGFRPQAFFPCYGLAEATLIVSGGPKGNGPRTQTVKSSSLERHQFVAAKSAAPGTQTLVSSGKRLPELKLRIVDPETCKSLPDGRVGEIWVSGESVAQGYWNNAPVTEERLQAFLTDSGEGPFLRTGDLGVFLDEELFVTGRIKDLIIIRGLNYYSQDIELTVERCHPSFPSHAGVAFSVEQNGTERLVVVQEIRHRKQLEVEKLFAVIRQAVVREHGLEPYEIVIVRYGSVPKTSSGKIQRQACRDSYLRGVLRVICAWRDDSASSPSLPSLANDMPLGEALESWLRRALTAYAGVSFADHPAEEEISWAGLDSLKAVNLIHRIETELGVSLSLSKLMQGMTVNSLVRECVAQLITAATKRETKPASSQSSPATDAATQTHPLSYGQRGFWFLHQVPAELSPDNIHIAARLRQSLDVAALRVCLIKLTERHSILRTTYTAHQGSPLQYVRAEMEAVLHEVNASGWDAETLQHRLVQEAHHRFDLEREPLLRVHLWQQGPDKYTLLLVIHHSVADMWSLSIIARELSILYEAEVRAQAVTLPPVSAEYHDFVYWQREFVAGPTGDKQWQYWQAQLAGDLPSLNLPADHARSMVQSFRGATVRIAIPPVLTCGLRSLSKKNGTSLYVTLLAAFQLLLHVHTGQEEQVVGSPATGRTAAKWREVLGYFVNVLPLRARFDPNISFNELHCQVKETVWEALENQDYPFNLLVERLNPRRNLNRSPLVQAMFVYQNIELGDNHELASFTLGQEGARLDLGGLRLESVFVEKQATRFDLTLFLADTPHGLVGTIEYNTELFERASMERLQGHWERLLEGIVREPTRAISALPLLSDAEQHQLLVEWNQTALSGPVRPVVQQQFLEWVRRQPQATAVVWGNERVSYGELQRRAARVARRLQQLGVKREGRVGVMLRRGPALVAALLGVLEAGAAYVPLDEEYPAERVEFMLADAGVEVLVCEEEQAERWGTAVREVLVLRAAEPSAAEEESGSAPEEEIEGEQIAYVIYTSGSTGRPKGVAITHRSAAVFLQWVGKQFTPQQLAGTLFSTSICFDLSVFELFAPLSYGGMIIVAENALQLPQLPAANEVTLLNTVPSAMTELLRMNAVPASVEVVNLAGEALPGALVRKLYQLTSVQQVFNLYGPTEDTTYTTCEAVPREETCNPAIGRPIANTQIYLLNEVLQPVPVGVAAELYIGGDGLARGYLNWPELTAERFVPDVFSACGGTRLYRTGDLARFRPDGRIEYLGRLDQQVKLRGFRIELGEIETVLLEHPGVSAVVVDAQETGELQKSLIAYLVSQNTQPAVAELRAYLKRRLPQHMIPQGYVWLSELPLTPNGKINRRALPAPPALRAVTESYLAPRTLTEELLAEIWQQVLRVERVGVEDDFFELGGHSLLATQVVSRMKETLQVELSIHSLFTSPTIARLAELVDDWQQQSAPVNIDPIIPVPRHSRRLTVSLDAVRSGRLL